MLELRRQQVLDELAYLGGQKLVTMEGDHWKAVGAEAQPLPIALPSDDTADHGREPTLALAQDAAA